MIMLDHRCPRCGSSYANVYLRSCACDDVENAEIRADVAERERDGEEENCKEAEKALEVAEDKLRNLDDLCSELAKATDVNTLWTLRGVARTIIEKGD